MIIYIDLVIITNFIIDLFLLMGVSYLLKRNTSIYRLILSSLIASILSILIIYIKYTIIYKLFISILMVLISFKYKSFNYFKDNIVWLYILSIILGGMIYLINNSINLKINIILLIVLTPLIIYLYIKNIRHYKLEYSNYYKVYIYYKDVCIKDIGFMDTGNNLIDPYFHKPIILVNKTLIKGYVKIFLVPYYTVNHNDLLEVFKPDKVVIDDKVYKHTLIGLSDACINGVNIILNKEMR